ncbi:MAG: hypothetical protein A2Y15_09300 [Clostridiales bacterium GWF2_36_10]|nr:MAG: hypothetical protein A2Y15_09300 [Clostridiales bacterium GWF2_36_10]HAN21424.1 hypothetical protein [Clostridiales bacterium]
MQFDNDTLRRLVNLDDESFRNIIRQISAAAGADSAKTESFITDVRGIKQSLSRMSPEQAEKILNSAGKEKSDQILRIINGGR